MRWQRLGAAVCGLSGLLCGVELGAPSASAVADDVRSSVAPAVHVTARAEQGRLPVQQVDWRNGTPRRVVRGVPAYYGPPVYSQYYSYAPRYSHSPAYYPGPYTNSNAPLFGNAYSYGYGIHGSGR